MAWPVHPGRTMRPFFIIGPPLTGNTLLTRLLVQHPDIECLSSSSVLSPTDPASVCHPGGEAAAAHGFTRADTQRWADVVRNAAPADALRTVLTEAFGMIAERTGATVVGDASVYHPLDLPTLLQAFPDARFIYTVRDPRALYEAAERHPDPNQGVLVTTEVLRSDRRVRAFVEKGLPQGHAAVVRFETMIEKTDEILEKLWRFLDVDPTQGWVDYDAARDALPERWRGAGRVTEPLDAGVLDRWQGIRLEARRVVGLAAAEYAATYGYPVELEEPYLPDEMIAAFLCGGPVSHYPIQIEDHVRAELLSTYLPALAAGLRGQSTVEEPAPETATAAPTGHRPLAAVAEAAPGGE